jgi:hypothetical protein
MASGYEKSHDYAGPAVRLWAIALGIALFVVAMCLLRFLFYDPNP